MPTQTKIRELRRAVGLTQGELALRTGMSLRGIGKLDRGEVAPQRTTAILLAAALGCKPADLRDMTAPGASL